VRAQKWEAHEAVISMIQGVGDGGQDSGDGCGDTKKRFGDIIGYGAVCVECGSNRREKFRDKALSLLGEHSVRRKVDSFHFKQIKFEIL
jgi:hypothetical protein